MKNYLILLVVLLGTLSSCIESVDPVNTMSPPVGFDYIIEDGAITLSVTDGRVMIAYYASEEYPVGCFNCDATYWDEYRVNGLVCNDQLPPFELDDRKVIRVTTWKHGAATAEEYDALDEVYTLEELIDAAYHE